MSDTCDREVYDNGEGIVVLDACMYRAEEWVQSVARESGQKVDWHYVGGRVLVKYIGDKEKVLEAIAKLTPDLKLEPMKQSTHKCRCSGPKHSSCRIIGSY